jgi:hypothetical protein
MSRICACIALVSAASAAIAADDYQPLPLNQVPKAVRDAVMKRFPEAKPQEAHQGTDENKKPYVDVHILVKNQKIWVTCETDGSIRTVDREIALPEVPKAVAAAIQKRYPKAAVRLVNEITEGSAPTYDIALTFNKKKLIATFSAAGELVEESEDDEP